MNVISLYSGAGGIDYGFEAAGFETRVCIDLDKDACATLRANRSWPVIEANIADVTPEQILASSGIRDDQVDMLIGGPPCQPFSKSGFWWRGEALRLDDPRAGTIGHYLRLIRALLPRVILFENVDAISYEGKDEGLQLLLDGFEALNNEVGVNYTPTYKILDAADFGVPQHRTRFFLVAARDGGRFRFPESTHGETELAPPAGLEPYSTAWDGIGDLDTVANDKGLALSGKWAGLLPSIPEGQNYLWHTSRNGGEPLFGWRTRYWSFLLKLAKDLPSWTLQAQPGPAIGPFHWRNRHLTARELCRLQTFPDDVVVTGDRRTAQKLLGNAVPSLLAEVLAREIRSQFFREAHLSAKPVLLPPRRTPVPARQTPEPVPGVYKHLVGNHAEHPGTGKGPSASARRTLQSAKLVTSDSA